VIQKDKCIEDVWLIREQREKPSMSITGDEPGTAPSAGGSCARDN